MYQVRNNKYVAEYKCPDPFHRGWQYRRNNTGVAHNTNNGSATFMHQGTGGRQNYCIQDNAALHCKSDFRLPVHTRPIASARENMAPAGKYCLHGKSINFKSPHLNQLPQCHLRRETPYNYLSFNFTTVFFILYPVSINLVPRMKQVAAI